MKRHANDTGVSGEFVDLDGERYYVVRNADKMPPFFISVVSGGDHWLFVSSTGGLTAGRVSANTSLFPYIPVDRIHDSSLHTGGRTLFRVRNTGGKHLWEPFNPEQKGLYRLRRNLYKNAYGDRLCFEEINHDLKLVYRYRWMTSEQYGFVRHCELENFGDDSFTVNALDGLQNILPAGTPRALQAVSSNLVDAYKWNELDSETGLAFYTLYSGITDRPEPYESLRANTVFCLGVEDRRVLLTSEQIDEFRRSGFLNFKPVKRGVRGAYMVNFRCELPPGATKQWQFVANIEQSQCRVTELQQELKTPSVVSEAVSASIDSCSDDLVRIVAAADGLQMTAEEEVSAHHYANVLFNLYRGGIFYNQYKVPVRDFTSTLRHFNRDVYRRNREMLESFDGEVDYSVLFSRIQQAGDPQLVRLALEYLPITFGRRHGDPSRPWNEFTIRLRNRHGERLLSYEGNWRDIFQNWEALVQSYPEFVENIIARFVNASTVDGHNPYRVTKEGIDWEVEDPEDPWSYIGYWGDHQIIYLLKLLEHSGNFHPERLAEMLHLPVFCYANVPYRIKPFSAVLQDPKNTVDYDAELASRIEQRVESSGADGKLLLDDGGEVYLVNLIEKLLVPLLAKLGNLVIDGGIWLNTQRPEWNDANNALVGQGLSMVTLYYMRRYIQFLQKLFSDEPDTVDLSIEVSQWAKNTASVLARLRPYADNGSIDGAARYNAFVELGKAASQYRLAVYQREGFTGKTSHGMEDVRALLQDALAAADYSLANNRCKNGLYNAYNLLNIHKGSVTISTLYPMLEGQVAALSSGAVSPKEAVGLLESLFDSALYRPDQKTFMLYPDRRLPGFLEKNRISAERVERIPVLLQMLDDGNEEILQQDADGCFRFNADLTSIGELDERLEQLMPAYGDALAREGESVRALYEEVFDHKAFTGRSGGMFGFEGLGCVYWHMVSKLLVAVQECYFDALDGDAEEDTVRRLGELYYRVREGIGFNKTPAEYGAFPTDPYSHTPRHAGAQQPGMTGQVKEEILTRFGELGVRVKDGTACFQPSLLRAREFDPARRSFRCLAIDGEWMDLEIPENSLVFTWCQVPVVYRLQNDPDSALTVHFSNGSDRVLDGHVLTAELTREVFMRSGRIQMITVLLDRSRLFSS